MQNISSYEPGNHANPVKKLLLDAEKNNWKINLSQHAVIRAKQRQINEKDIWENIKNPKNLYYVKKSLFARKNEARYQCYFKKSGQQCHIYGLIFNFVQKFIKIATVIKSRPKLQKVLK